MQAVLPGVLPEGRLRSAPPRRPLSRLESSKAALGLELEAGRICRGAPGLPPPEAFCPGTWVVTGPWLKLPLA